MSEQKIKLFGTASYNIQGAVALLSRVAEGDSYQKVLDAASACLAHTPKSHMKAIRGSIISALLKFDESRNLLKDPLLTFVDRVTDEGARKEAIFFHILRHNFTLFKVCERLVERYRDGEVNRKEMIKFIFENTKSEKGSEYTIQKAFRILKDYGYLGRTQPDVVKTISPRAESLGYIIYRLFGAGENPAPSVDEIVDAPFVKASFFSREGILEVLDAKENEWWYREKTSRSDSITLRFYDASEFVEQLERARKGAKPLPAAKAEPVKPAAKTPAKPAPKAEPAKPAAKPEPVKTAAKAPAKPVAKPVVKPPAKPAAKSAPAKAPGKPATKPAPKPALKKPAAKAPAKPAAKPSAKPKKR